MNGDKQTKNKTQFISNPLLVRQELGRYAQDRPQLTRFVVLQLPKGNMYHKLGTSAGCQGWILVPICPAW